MPNALKFMDYLMSGRIHSTLHIRRIYPGL